MLINKSIQNKLTPGIKILLPGRLLCNLREALATENGNNFSSLPAGRQGLHFLAGNV